MTESVSQKALDNRKKFGPIDALAGKTIAEVVPDRGYLLMKFTDGTVYELLSSYSHSYVFVERVE